MAENFSGRIDRVELKRAAPYNIGNGVMPNQWDWFVDVRLVLDDGRTLYFKSPRIVEDDGEFNKQETDFLKVKENGNMQSKVEEGDRITIKGRPKAEKVSKAGNPYFVTTHNKLVEHEPLERSNDPFVADTIDEINALLRGV